MNNLKDKNAKIEETESDVRNNVRQTTIESEEYLKSANSEEIYKDKSTALHGRGSDPCPDGQRRNPITGNCEDAEEA